jgi:hypothetical protein
MSATLAPPTSPRTAAATYAPPTLVEVPAAQVVDEATTEMHRWLIGLGTPFVLGAVFFALSIATPAEWLIGVALALGPMLFMFMTIYLCISSDSNGKPTYPAAVGGAGG